MELKIPFEQPCPKCGKPVKLDFAKLKKIKSVKCSHCNTLIEILTEGGSRIFRSIANIERTIKKVTH